MGHNVPLKDRYKKAWSWPKDIEDFIRARAQGRILHVCCGTSLLGDIKVDAFVQGPDIITKDIRECNFQSEFDTVISDPPWAMDYRARPSFIRTCRNALKIGGHLIFNAPWVPKYYGLQLQEVWYRIPSPGWANLGVISISLRTKIALQEELIKRAWEDKKL